MLYNSKTVNRAVYASSSSAVTFNGKGDEVADESFWSGIDNIKASKLFGWSYAISKTLTEKAVLEFGEENGLDVVTVVPTFVLGPFICPKLPGSVFGIWYVLQFATCVFYHLIVDN